MDELDWINYYRDQRDHWQRRTYELSSASQRWIIIYTVLLIAALVGWVLTGNDWMR